MSFDNNSTLKYTFWELITRIKFFGPILKNKKKSQNTTGNSFFKSVSVCKQTW